MDFRPLKKERDVGEIRASVGEIKASMGDDGYLRGSYRGWSCMGFGKNGAKPISTNQIKEKNESIRTLPEHPRGQNQYVVLYAYS